MANTTLVQILNAADELPVKLGSLRLVQPSISDDEVEQFTTVGMLHDHEEFFLSLDDLVQLNDIGVSDLLKNLDLPCDPFHVLLVIDLFFLKDFDSYLFARQNVRALLDLAESALAQWFTEYVVTDGHVVLVFHSVYS